MYPTITRARKVPKKFEHTTNAVPSTELDGETNFRKNYFEILDLLMTELKDPFDQGGLKTLIRLENLLDPLQGKDIPNLDDFQMLLKPFSYDFDVDLLRTEVKMLSSITLDPRSECCKDLAEILSKESKTVKSVLRQVIQLLIIV